MCTEIPYGEIEENDGFYKTSSLNIKIDTHASSCNNK